MRVNSTNQKQQLARHVESTRKAPTCSVTNAKQTQTMTSSLKTAGTLTLMRPCTEMKHQATKFKTERLSNQLRDMSPDDYDGLRQAVFKIADGYQALKEIKTKTTNPDVHRLFSNLDEIYNGGSLEIFLEVM
jgi:hypothetical protein